MRSAAFLHALEGMPADQARAWASKAGVVMDGRDLPYGEGRCAVWDKDHVAFVDIRGGTRRGGPVRPVRHRPAGGLEPGRMTSHANENASP